MAKTQHTNAFSRAPFPDAKRYGHWEDVPPKGPVSPEGWVCPTTPTSDAFRRDAIVAQAKAGDWLVRAAALRGRSHAHRGEYRQDWVHCATDGRWLLAVLADGCGSEDWAHTGAGTLVTTAVKVFLETTMQEGVERLGTILRRTVRALLLAAQTSGVSSGKLAATCRVLLFDSIEQIAYVTAVGDGMTILEQGESCQILWPVPEPKTARATAYVPRKEQLSLEGWAEVKTIKASSDTSVFLASDGLDPLVKASLRAKTSMSRLIDRKADLPQGFSFPDRMPTRSLPSDTDELVSILGFEARGVFDDRSLIALTPAERRPD